MGSEPRLRREEHIGTRGLENSIKGCVKASSVRALSFGCFKSLFSVALFKLVFNLLFSLCASFIFILLYQKRLDLIPSPALLAFWSLISFEKDLQHRFIIQFSKVCFHLQKWLRQKCFAGKRAVPCKAA